MQRTAMTVREHSRGAKARTKKHRKAHSLVQIWVSPRMKRALDLRARREDRTLANFVRRELAKIVGIKE